jgi:hypothetical protein
MKSLFALLAVFSFAAISTVRANDLIIDGSYQMKNVYVSNPTSPEGFGFCAYEVMVNGVVTTDEVNSPTFEIDLGVMNLTLGQPLTIVIRHKEGCEPTVANPFVLQPMSTFACPKIEVGKDGVINWTTTGEIGSIPFIVEQFKWNKWVKIGEVPGKGNAAIANDYTFKATLISGENIFRVSQQSFDGGIRSSQSAKIAATIEPLTHTVLEDEGRVKFSAKTNYEIVDAFGQVINSGFGTSVSIKTMEKGKYFINFDNQSISYQRK